MLNNTGVNNSFTVGANPGLFNINRTATLSEVVAGGVGAANVVVNTQGTFNVDASQSNLANMGTLGNLTVGGGTFNFIGGTGIQSTLNIGTLTLAQGSSTVTTLPGTSGSVALSGTSLVRNAGATVDFIGPNLGVAPTDQITFTNVPATQGSSNLHHIGILPYALVNGGATGAAAPTWAASRLTKTACC